MIRLPLFSVRFTQRAATRIPGPSLPCRRTRATAPTWRRVLLAAGALLAAAVAPAQPGPGPIQPLAPPPAPAGNPVTTAKANLGKALFWDEQMSSSRTVSCGTCHQAPAGGSDPRSVIGAPGTTHPGADLVFGTPDDATASPGVALRAAAGGLVWETSFGVRPQVTPRKTPSFIDAGYSATLFWDGRADASFEDPLTGAVLLAQGAALESQALAPPVSATEMGHTGRDWADVAARMETVRPLALAPSIPAALEAWIDGRDYPALFAEAYGTPDVTPARIAMALATYQRTLFSNQTPLDDDARGVPGALTAQERRGRDVFVARNCAACHGGTLTTDNLFHYTGVRPANEDLGRFTVTGAPGDRGAFRTPSLRNVELRAPYMHNGRFPTLESVVDFYNRGGDFTAPNKSPLVVPLNLGAQERADLLAFLRRPLTDPRVAAGSAPFDRPGQYAESDRVPAGVGTGTAGSGGQVPLVVALEPPLLGNPTFTVAVERGLGGATAILVIDDVDPGPDADIPATASFARREVVLARSGAGQGYASVVLSIPSDAAWAGREVFGRWFVVDAGAAGGVAASAAFRMTFFGTPDGGIGVSGLVIY